MIRSFENEKLLMGPRMKDSLKGWDMSSRYWFWKYAYKGMIRGNRDVRCVFAKVSINTFNVIKAGVSH